MKTSVIEVHDMLSVLGVDEVEKRIGEVPGVESVTVNFAAGGATVRYDETRLEIADVKSTVRQRGYEPAVPATPAHAVDVHHQAKQGRQRHQNRPQPSRPLLLPPRSARPNPPTLQPRLTKSRTKRCWTKARATVATSVNFHEVGATSNTDAPGARPSHF